MVVPWRLLPEVKLGRLREMWRVLRPHGRLLLNLPGPAAGFVLHVFSRYDETQITEMMNAAGFRAVNVQAARKTLHLPAAKTFLWQYVRNAGK